MYTERMTETETKINVVKRREGCVTATTAVYCSVSVEHFRILLGKGSLFEEARTTKRAH